jgi:PAS domain S-box-containing protein
MAQCAAAQPPQPQIEMSDNHFTTRSALSIALIYAVIGCLWILLSDKAVAVAFADPAAILLASMLKGWFYVGATSLLLFLLVRHFLGKLHASYRREVDNYAAKQRTHDLLAAIAENSDDAIFAKDLKGRYLLFNNAASRYVGKPIADVLGQDDRALFPAEQAAMLMAIDDRIVATGQVENNEELLDTALGPRSFLATKGPLRDGDKRIFGTFGISRDISGMKYAEQALLENEVRLRMLIQNSPAALAMFDREMCYLAVSNRWLTDFGLVDGKVIGRSHYEVLPEIGEDLRDIHRRGLAGEVIRRDEDRFVRADGSTQWLRWEMRPWREPEGTIGGIVIYSEDISRRMASEIALRESEHRFHAIVESTADWIWEVDVEGRYTYVSDSVYALLGYTPAELIGRRPFDLMPPDEAERVAAEFRAIVARKAPFRDLDNLNIHKDGRLIHVSSSGMPILAADGSLIGYRGLDHDISERKATEIALQRLAADMSATLQAIPDLMFELDAEGRYLKVKATHEALLAAPIDQVLGRKVTEVLPPEAAVTVMEALAAASRAGADYGRTISLPLAQGAGHFEISVARKPVAEGQGERFIVLSRDITARRTAEDQLRQRNEELERFNRATVGREIDMLEMKKTINALSQELGRKPPYPLAFVKDADGKGVP